MKEFLSSFLLIVSWFIFAVTLYLFVWTLIMPSIALIPFLVSLTLGVVCFYFSKRLNVKSKVTI